MDQTRFQNAHEDDTSCFKVPNDKPFKSSYFITTWFLKARPNLIICIRSLRTSLMKRTWQAVFHFLLHFRMQAIVLLYKFLRMLLQFCVQQLLLIKNLTTLLQNDVCLRLHCLELGLHPMCGSFKLIDNTFSLLFECFTPVDTTS